MAAFAQSNEGDVSPNILGAHCIDTGLPCDPVHSTCNGKVRGDGEGEGDGKVVRVMVRVMVRGDGDAHAGLCDKLVLVHLPTPFP